MGFELKNYIVSPVTKEKLSFKGGKLIDESGNTFKVINNVPICANFWYLPFADFSIDSVFTNNGLEPVSSKEFSFGGGKIQVVSQFRK